MVFKRLLAAAVSAALVLSCAACGNQAEPENTTEPTTVYTPEKNTTTAITETTTAEILQLKFQQKNLLRKQPH